MRGARFRVWARPVLLAVLLIAASCSDSEATAQPQPDPASDRMLSTPPPDPVPLPTPLPTPAPEPSCFSDAAIMQSVLNAWSNGTGPVGYTTATDGFDLIDAVYRWDGALGGRLVGAWLSGNGDEFEESVPLVLLQATASEDDCESLREVTGSNQLVFHGSAVPNSVVEPLAQHLAEIYAKAVAGRWDAVSSGPPGSIRIFPAGEARASHLWRTVPRGSLDIHVGAFAYPADANGEETERTLAYCRQPLHNADTSDYAHPSLTFQLDMAPLTSGTEQQGALVATNNGSEAVGFGVWAFANLEKHDGTARGLLTGFYLANTATYQYTEIQPGTSETFGFLVGTASCDPVNRASPMGQYVLSLKTAGPDFSNLGGVLRFPVEVRPLPELPFVGGICPINDPQVFPGESEGMLALASGALEVTMAEAAEYAALGDDASAAWLEERRSQMLGMPSDVPLRSWTEARANLALLLPQLQPDSRIFLGSWTGDQYWWAVEAADTFFFGGVCQRYNWTYMWRSQLLPYLKTLQAEAPPGTSLADVYVELLADPEASNQAFWEWRRGEDEVLVLPDN